MNSTDFSTELFCKLDDAITDATRHSQAILSVSEVVTIGILYAVKGVSQRAFYPWLKDNYGCRSPNCRNAPAASAACIVNNTGQGASWPSPP